MILYWSLDLCHGLSRQCGQDDKEGKHSPWPHAVLHFSERREKTHIAWVNKVTSNTNTCCGKSTVPETESDRTEQFTKVCWSDESVVRSPCHPAPAKTSGAPIQRTLWQHEISQQKMFEGQVRNQWTNKNIQLTPVLHWDLLQKVSH